MKKAIIASVIALGMGAGVANAAPDKNAGTTDLNFEGTVSATTCALVPEVDGKNGVMDVKLGQTNPNTKGQDVEVVFKPAAASLSSCQAATTDFVMSWEGKGSSFGTNGLAAAAGSTASDSFVQISATNAKVNNNTMATAEKFQYEFAKDTVVGDGLKYNVALMGGNTVGDMTAAATVNYWYK